ncbi:ead/Ea22-like family protein [Salmonella enterica subsp. enterica serovar Cubana]|uniref:ead/Ea22-like family protein n=1 Tax=Salmonella enterica TaxID=28901 RepID=UPI0009ACCA70|nr:ead/Ea22-like family protein [Salmonella enterica]EGF6382910.1 ead/Ea22-like family protein [Salmonella enterica subsp. enterica serovar Cubana]
MTIDKRALREVAEKATPGTWRRTSSLFNGITVTPFSLCGEEVTLAHTVEKRDAEFIAAANPATMLALLDENIQLQREKDAIEAVALALRDDMRQAREQLEAAEKRNAEQREYYEGVIADGSKRIAELEGGAFNPAILDVVAERQRQKTIEGWTPEHDDEHCNGELAMAAVCYINETGTVNRNGGKPWGWPWDASWWKPNARRRNLVKAGALILAEIERIDRAAGIGKGE